MGCVPVVEVIKESFADVNSADGFTNGARESSVSLSDFLSVDGSGSLADEVSRSFGIEMFGSDDMLESVNVTFQLYQIDAWSAGDKFVVEVNGEVIELELEPVSGSPAEACVALGGTAIGSFTS